MKRAIAMVIASLVAAATLAPCGLFAVADTGADPSAIPSFEELTTGQSGSAKTPSATEKREIVCWGDSMTRGNGAGKSLVNVDGAAFGSADLSYPQILGWLTGIPTFNFGVDGASSEEIVYMQRGYLPESSEDDEAAEELEHIDTGLMEQARAHTGDILVLEIGSNGGWDGDYGTLIEQYRSMIDYAQCDRYIIIGDTDDPGTSTADPDQQAFDGEEAPGQTDWEAALQEAFGEHFINMRIFLIEHGLQTAGLTPTDDDESAAQRGCISDQLRADWTHLNSRGYYAKAVALYEKGRSLGYWS